MKQVLQDFRTGQLRVDEVPPPMLRPGGVLVRVARSLISAGTERTAVETAQSSLLGKARQRPDLVRQVLDTFKREGVRSTYEKVKARLNQVKPLGYSAAGIVIAVGSGAQEFRVGERVACAGAGYASHAEVIFVPKNLCAKVPEAVSLEAACYATVGAIALHGVRQAEVQLGEAVAVIGLGLVGQLTVQLLKANACQVLGIDIDPAACQLAKRSGADAVAQGVLSARAACEVMTEGRGADCVIITAATKSSQPIELAGELARDRARVVVVGLVGMNLPRHTFYAKELELRLSRSYGPGRYDPDYEQKGSDYPIGYVRWTEKRNLEAFLNLVAEGKINTEILTTHRFPIERAEQAYNVVLGKSEGHAFRCGVVLEYAGAESETKSTISFTRSGRLRQTNQSTDEIGVGFIGAGNFARGVLLPILRRSNKVRLNAVATATGVSAKNTAEQFGFSYATTDPSCILSDEQTHCIFIATRHDSHARLAAECLKGGKAVFVEKPLATTEEELREVIAAARDSGGLLMVGYNRRFAPIARQIKDCFSDRTGPMTIVYRVNAGQLPPRHWALDAAEGGGRVIGEVCHFIDFIQFLTDSLPVRVSAESVPAVEKAGYVDDSVVISLRMSDGSVASIIYAAGGDSSVAKERIEVFCDRSFALIDDFRRGEFINRGRARKFGGRTQDKGHAAEISAFFDAVRGRADAPIRLESLVATALATFAVVECLKSGQAATINLSIWL
jgi:predicted dehydrogenase/threonine dehydrogenase-like Zn-dependent dehydrogenase